ncbi:MAG: preprotein translocase subunit YajC [Bacteroidales bacterium]|nr:preprotein translocase subunit YajC [Bacteroidales bacterium]
MNNFLFIFLMPQTEGKSPVPSFVFLLLIILVFYLFMIRPQMKRQKDLKTYRQSLKQGDKIVTTGGIYGKITDIKDTTVTVEIADNIRVRIDKSAVVQDNTDLQAQK